MRLSRFHSIVCEDSSSATSSSYRTSSYYIINFAKRFHVRIDEWNIAEWSVVRFSSAICVLSVISKVVCVTTRERVATTCNFVTPERCFARAESSARKIVRGRDALVANRRLRHCSRISKVSGARLSYPRRRRHHRHRRRHCRRRHCCSVTWRQRR